MLQDRAFADRIVVLRRIHQLTRLGNTGREIVASGEFRLLGKKHYAHVASGLQIQYDRRKWAWVGSDGLAFTALHKAVSWLRTSIAKEVVS